MKYKLKRVNIKVDDVSGINFPALKDREIIKTGHEDIFTLNQIEAAQAHYQKTLKELKAQIELDSAKMINIEHFHPEVKDYTDEQLVTAWLYQESKGRVKLYTEKAAEIEEQLAKDAEEVAEILKQIPELKVSPVVEEATKIINEQN